MIASASKWTPEQAALWNWFKQSAPGPGKWRTWAAEALGELLQVPAATRACITATHCLEPGRDQIKLVVTKRETTIGRAEENDIVLTGQSVTKQHARIIQRSGSLQIQDLGSTMGTFIGKRQLQPSERYELSNGTQITIFPYTLDVEIERSWAAAGPASINTVTTSWKTWNSFTAEQLAGAVSFPLHVEPLMTDACLEVDHALLGELIKRLMYPKSTSADAAGLLNADRGLLEFLLLAVMARANTSLGLPFRLGLRHAYARPHIDDSTEGIAVSCQLGLSGLIGSLRLFLPAPLLERVRAKSPDTSIGEPPVEVAWPLLFAVGWSELTPSDLTIVEPGDIILLTNAGQALLDREKGWNGRWSDDRRIFAVADYFERTFSMGESNETGRFDPVSLPVRLHAVVGERQMTLAELTGLREGALISLERDINEPVEIYVNGRSAGKGEIVDIAGKLGVKVLSWMQW